MQNVAFGQTLRRLPPVFRQSNTTFVNLRAALDDLDPLVETAKPATKNLAPFLAELRPVSPNRCPSSRTCGSRVRRPGKANDAAELLAALPDVQQRAAKAFPHAEDAIADFQPNLNFVRAYTPDIFNGFAKIGQVTGYYDGNGHYAADLLRRPQHLQLHAGASNWNRSRRASSTKPSAPPARQAPLPGRRHPARHRRLQPVRRTALQRLRRPRPSATRPTRHPDHDQTPPRTALLLVAAVVAVVLLASGGDDEATATWCAPSSTTAPSWSTASRSASPAPTSARSNAVDVSMPGEIVTYEDGKPDEEPGKAVIVMKIDDPGFQDFRSDARCLIRPQSLIGEKYVDCRPTLPRAPGTGPRSAAEGDPRRPAGRRPVPAAAREQQRQRRPGPDQRHPDAALRAALPADLQRTRRHLGRPRRGHRGGRQARQPGPARRRPPLRDPLRSATNLRSLRATRTRSSSRSPGSAPASRLYHQLAPPLRPSSELGSDVEESLEKVPPVPARIRQRCAASGLLPTSPPRRQTTWEGRPVAHRSDPHAGAVPGRRDRRAEAGATGEATGPAGAKPPTRPQGRGTGERRQPTTELAEFFVSTRRPGLGRPWRTDRTHAARRVTSSHEYRHVERDDG